MCIGPVTRQETGRDVLLMSLVEEVLCTAPSISLLHTDFHGAPECVADPRGQLSSSKRGRMPKNGESSMTMPGTFQNMTHNLSRVCQVPCGSQCRVSNHKWKFKKVCRPLVREVVRREGKARASPEAELGSPAERGIIARMRSFYSFDEPANRKPQPM